MDEIVQVSMAVFTFLICGMFLILIAGLLLGALDDWLDGKLKEKCKEFLQ